MSIWRVSFVIVAHLALVASALGQSEPPQAYWLDIYDMVIHVYDEAGEVDDFDSTHSGRIDFDLVGSTELGAATSPTGKAVALPLSAITGSLFLHDGIVTSGTLNLQVESGEHSTDIYSTSITAGSGTITPGIKDVYGIQGLTFEDGSLIDGDADGQWGSVPLLAELAGLAGSFSFGVDNSRPVKGGGLWSDAQGRVVVVPLPSAAYAGLFVLAGALGLSYAARRR